MSLSSPSPPLTPPRPSSGECLSAACKDCIFGLFSNSVGTPPHSLLPHPGCASPCQHTASLVTAEGWQRLTATVWLQWVDYQARNPSGHGSIALSLNCDTQCGVHELGSWLWEPWPYELFLKCIHIVLVSLCHIGDRTGMHALHVVLFLRASKYSSPPDGVRCVDAVAQKR